MCYNNFFFRLLPGVLLSCLCLTGCSNNMAVTGQVTYSDNGEPVQSGMVVFSGDKEMGRGVIKNGRYSIGLTTDGGGISPGTYSVSSNSLPSLAYEEVDMFGNRSTVQPEPKELYYTKEPKIVEVTKSMTYDFTVERGERPSAQ